MMLHAQAQAGAPASCTAIAPAYCACAEACILQAQAKNLHSASIGNHASLAVPDLTERVGRALSASCAAASARQRSWSALTVRACSHRGCPPAAPPPPAPHPGSPASPWHRCCRCHCHDDAHRHRARTQAARTRVQIFQAVPRTSYRTHAAGAARARRTPRRTPAPAAAAPPRGSKPLPAADRTNQRRRTSTAQQGQVCKATAPQSPAGKAARLSVKALVSLLPIGARLTVLQTRLQWDCYNLASLWQ